MYYGANYGKLFKNKYCMDWMGFQVLESHNISFSYLYFTIIALPVRIYVAAYLHCRCIIGNTEWMRS